VGFRGCDITLADGEAIAGLTALHTPGHAADHLSFACPDGMLFSADVVMTWSTTVVSPPDGDMAAYMASLRRLIARADGLLLPGHGPPLAQPAAYLRALLAHREQREAAVLGAISAGPLSAAAVVERLYVPLDPRLAGAAERSVLAHLIKLAAEGRAVQAGDAWRAA
jgi:glyoxylase-like metal-dependent hydrolase (beta-lactamase superfamily II)